MRPITILTLFAVLLIGGCAWPSQADIARWRVVAEDSKVKVEKLESTITSLRTMLVAAQEIAKQTGSSTAAEAVAKVQNMLVEAQEALPLVKSAAKGAAETLQTMEAAAASGGGWSDLLIAGLTAFLPTAAVAVQQYIARRRERDEAEAERIRHETALRLTAQHADAVEEVDPKDATAMDRVKTASQMAQAAAGVLDLIQTVRGKR